MKDYLKSYRMILKTAAPLFIGDGRNLNKKEYLYIRHEKKVLIPDLGRLFSDVSRKQLGRQFTEYLLDKNDRSGLEQWLRNHRFTPADYKKWTLYELEGGDHLGEDKRPMEISTFIKDSYGLPYIPGTSIKGLIRNLLLSYELFKNPELCADLRQNLPEIARRSTERRNLYLNRERKKAETEVFHTLIRQDQNGKLVDTGNAVNDTLSGLIISDSNPLAWKDMMLCQKIDRSIEGNINNKLNILREAVKPGVSIEFQLTIDTSICKYTIEDVMAAVKAFGEMYYDYYLSRFSGTDRPAEDVVWLGGGAGFLTKTVLYPMLGQKNGVRTAVALFEHTVTGAKHTKDISEGISPHMLKCTEYKGKVYHMGQCHLIVETGGNV